MSPYVAPGIRAGDVLFVRTESVEYYKETVAQFFNIPVEKLDMKTRKREIVEARQIAMYLAEKYGKYKLKTIGESFGGRDHTTVIHSRHTVNDLRETDEVYRLRLEYLERRLYEGGTIGHFEAA